MSQYFENLSLAASAASNALTVALRTNAGTDPSLSNPVSIPFRNATLTDSTYIVRCIAGAVSMTLSVGSTLGFGNGETGRLYVWIIDNAGAVELALSRTADLFPEDNLVSTTAEGGGGGADSATIMYSTTARSSVPCRCLGYVEIQMGVNGWKLEQLTVEDSGNGAWC